MPRRLRQLALTAFAFCALVQAQTPPPAEIGPPAAPALPETADRRSEGVATREVMKPLRPEERDEDSPEDEGTPTAGQTATGVVDAAADPNLDDLPLLDAEGGEAGAESGSEEAKRRIWRLVPIVALGLLYDDNVFLTNTERQGDLIFNLNAGFAFELGDFRERQGNYLSLSYVGAAVFYGELDSLNSYNPRFDLLARYTSEPLTVELESVAFYQRGVQRQVGSFTTQIVLGNTLRFIYDYSQKSSFDLSLNQRANVYPDDISSYYYDVTLGFDYDVTSKLSLGLEGVLGLAESEGSPSMTYQVANLRLAYEATGKLTLKATGGLEFNQYTSGDEPMRILPVFSLGGEYRPFEGTVLSLLGYRNIESSPSLAQQDYIATGFEVGIRQAIGRRVSVGLALGYENDTYISNVSTVDATRVDDYAFARPGISYDFLKYLTASVFYEFRTNDSTLEADTWYDNRFGFEISASF